MQAINGKTMKIKARVSIFLFLVVFINLCSCSVIGKNTSNSASLPPYFYQEWIQSYEANSKFNSDIQIYRPTEDVKQVSGFTMRYRFNKDNSCLFWALKQYDEYKMETCTFIYKNKMLHVNDTSTTGGRRLTMKPLKILELTPKKLVIFSHYKLP